MAAESGVIELVFRAKLDQLDKDMQAARSKATGAAEQMGSEVESKVTSKLSGAGKAALGLGATLASAGIAAKLKDAAMAASDLGEAQNANNVIFKDGAPTIDAFAKGALKNLGLAEITVRNLASSVGGMFNAVGLESSVATEMTTGLITRARDVGSVFNESAQVVTEAFGAALRGESEPARRFGVFLNADALAAEALSSGLVKAEVSTVAITDAQFKAEAATKAHAEAVRKHGANSAEAAAAAAAMEKAQEAVTKAMEGSKVELTDAQKMQAAYQIIMRSTEVAAGDYANTQDSLANKTQRNAEAQKEAAATLGESVAPLMSKLTGLTTDLMDIFVKLPGPVQTGIAALLGIGVVAGPLGSLIGLFTTLFGKTVAQAGANVAAGGTAAGASGGFFAMAAGLWATLWPILAVLGAIALIALGVYLVIKHWDTIKEATGAAWNWVKDHIAVILQTIFVLLTGGLGLAVLAVVKNWDSIKAATAAAWDWVTDHIALAGRIILAVLTGGMSEVTMAVVRNWDRITEFTSSAWSRITEAVSGGISDVVSFMAGLPGRILGAVGNLGGLLWNAGVDVVRGLINGIGSMGSALWNAVTGFISRNIPGPVKKILGIGSPSKVAFDLMLDVGAGMVGGLEASQAMVARAAGSLGGMVLTQPSVMDLAVRAHTNASADLSRLATFGGDQAPASGGDTYIIQGSLVHERELQEMGRNGTARVVRYNGTPGF